MSDEIQKLAEDLVKSTQEYKELLAAIQKQDPELFQQFQETREKCENLESAVKAMLKKDPTAEVSVADEHKFRVSSSTKEELDLESTVLKAEGYGHIELLIEYGVLDFKGNASKIERLPEDIKPIYKKFISKKTTT